MCPSFVSGNSILLPANNVAALSFAFPLSLAFALDIICIGCNFIGSCYAVAFFGLFGFSFVVIVMAIGPVHQWSTIFVLTILCIYKCLLVLVVVTPDSIITWPIQQKNNPIIEGSPIIRIYWAPIDPNATFVIPPKTH